MRSPDGSSSSKVSKNKNDSQRNKGLRKKGSADSDKNQSSKSKKVKKKGNTAKKILTAAGNSSKKVHLERVNLPIVTMQRAGAAGPDQEPPHVTSPLARAPMPNPQAGQVVENDDHYVQFVPNNLRKDGAAAAATPGAVPPAATSPAPEAVIAATNDPFFAAPAPAIPIEKVAAPAPAPAATNPPPQRQAGDDNHYENFLPLALRK